MTRSVTYDLGEYRSQTYVLHGEDSSPHAPPDNFVVTVYYRDGELDRNIEIARVDTSHGDVHFDRLYRRNEPKDWGIEWDFWESMNRLSQNWRTYAESFDKK